MLEPRARWIFPSPTAIDPALLDAGQRLSLTPRVIGLLARRGVADPEALASFLGEPRDALHDPALLPDAAIFRDRIERA